MLPLASIVFQVAAVAVLLAVATTLVNAWRRRGTTTGRVPRLERAQGVAVVVAATGMAVGTFTDAEVVSAVWVAAIGVAIVLGVVRWRRGEPPLPSWL